MIGGIDGATILWFSMDASRVTVRVIRTDEERMIARSTCPRLGLGAVNKKD